MTTPLVRIGSGQYARRLTGKDEASAFIFWISLAMLALVALVIGSLF
jgi:hypothetical protein